MSGFYPDGLTESAIDRLLAEMDASAVPVKRPTSPFATTTDTRRLRREANRTLGRVARLPLALVTVADGRAAWCRPAWCVCRGTASTGQERCATASRPSDSGRPHPGWPPADSCAPAVCARVGVSGWPSSGGVAARDGPRSTSSSRPHRPRARQQPSSSRCARRSGCCARAASAAWSPTTACRGSTAAAAGRVTSRVLRRSPDGAVQERADPPPRPHPV